MHYVAATAVVRIGMEQVFANVFKNIPDVRRSFL